MGNNLDNKCIEENAIKEAIKTGVKELNEENKKEMKKAWLTQRISEVGEETLLYPKVNAKTHPYTKEVILIAGSQGYKQEPIRKICGVSQSQVSLWERGINQATIDQLAPLIAKLSPKVPGNTFHHKTVVTKTYYELPDEWEKVMLLNAYSMMGNSEPVLSFVNKDIEFKLLELQGNQYGRNRIDLSAYEDLSINEDYKSTNNSFYNSSRKIATKLKNKETFLTNYEDFEKRFLGNMILNQQDEMSALKNDFKEKKEKIEFLIEEILKAQEASDRELNEYNKAVVQNQEQRESYLLAHSELNDLPEKKLNNFLSKEFPSPLKNDKCSKRLNEILQDNLQTYNLKSDASVPKLLNTIESSISELNNQLSAASEILEENHKKELLEKTVLDKYKKSAEKKEIIFSNDTEIQDCSLINELASELYSEAKYTLTVPVVREVIGYLNSYQGDDKDFVGYESEDVAIDLSMADAFVGYCKTLRIKIDVEDIQICGDLLLRIEGSKLEVVDRDDDSDEDTDIHTSETDFFECFQLFNQGLLLTHCYEFEGEMLTYIYQVDNADEVLSEIGKCMNRHNWDINYQTICLENMKIKLLENGYRLASIRSIY